MKSHLSMITLGVRDFAKSRKFYEALGFRCEGEDTPGYVMFRTDGTRLSLFPFESLPRKRVLSSWTARRRSPSRVTSRQKKLSIV